MKNSRQDSGEVMLEGMIVMIMTMLLLIWILAVGFLHYQRYTLTIVTNDAAAKIAATYQNPGSDLIMGYVSMEDFSERDLFRWAGINKYTGLRAVNEEKAEAYIRYILEHTNFTGTIADVKVELKLLPDSPLRRHVEIRTECTFNTPFGEALEFFGMDGKVTYTACGRAECSDMLDYCSTVDFVTNQLKASALDSKCINFINSLIKLFNHVFEKK